MYQAKLKGRNSYQLFAPSMNKAAEKRLLIERGLREAINLGTLKLHYQPIIDLVTRDLIGCEALLRWNHPEDGLVSPDLFIDVAEQTGLIVPIWEWVLETDEQLDLVHRQGCDSAQGFLFYKPMEAADIERLLGEAERGSPRSPEARLSL